MWVLGNSYLCVCTYRHMHLCTCIYIYIYTYMYMYMFMYMYMYMYMCEHMQICNLYVCMCVRTYLYTVLPSLSYSHLECRTSRQSFRGLAQGRFQCLLLASGFGLCKLQLRV